MLIKELIVRHVGPQGALHERGLRLDDAQVPLGLTVQHEADDGADRDSAVDGADRDSAVDGPEGDVEDARNLEGVETVTFAPVSGDLVVVRVPMGPGLADHVDANLPLGATMLLLLEVELTELPVSRVLAALDAARLQVVEAVVVSGVQVATVAVVATRTDELVVPEPSLAHSLEPGDHTRPAVLRRLLGEHALDGLVHLNREHALHAQVAELVAQLASGTTELEKSRAAWQTREAALIRDLATTRKELETEREQLQSLRSSTTYQVAARLASASGVARRIIPRPGPGKPRG